MASDLVANLLQDPQQDEAGRPLSMSRYDGDLKKLARYVREVKERDLMQLVGGSSLLELLHPERNTISYLAVLVAYKNTSLKTRQLSPGQLDHTLTFLATFDAVQARYVGKELRELMDWLAAYYDNTHDASVIPAIGAAMLRLDPAGSTFTSTHLLFVRLCLGASLPRQALPVLDKDIYAFPTEPVKNIDDGELCGPHETSATYITKASGLTADIQPADVQEYYLLGAHVYIGLHQWARAILFLELVLASPTSHVATPFMVDAYKKLVLLRLLTSGHSTSTRIMLDQQAQKIVSSLAKAYDALAEVFKNRDFQRFQAELDVGLQIWTDDGNLGLVNQVAESLRRYRVIDLQKTYSALPVDRIATHLTLSTDNTTTLLTTMIRNGHIQATLDDTSPPVLRFLSHDSDQTPLTGQRDANILAKYEQIERLSKHVKEADRKLAISKEYVEFVRRNKRAEGAGAPGYEDPMEETWDAPTAGDGDEDMMGDLR